MKAKEFSELLISLRACEEARAWAKGKTLAAVWKTCNRGDWMLWLCGKMVDKPNWPTRQEVVLAACACAKPALKYVKAGEDRPRIALETARKWARGEATIQKVRDAAAADAAAYSAYYSAAAAYAAYYSAAAAAAAYYSAAAAAPAHAAAAAAYSAAAADAYAADAAAHDAYAAAKKKSQLESADICRKMLKVPTKETA